MTLGEKIKILRKKNDLTQEKLADYLGVAYQTVSKWECGVSNPDLSLIVPLTKLLHVSADELFGLTDQQPDIRRQQLKEEHDDTYRTGDLVRRYEVAKMAVEEYSGDLEYLSWLADAEYYRAFSLPNEEAREEMEKSVRNYQRIIEDSADPKLLDSALCGIVLSLSALGRREEAKSFALRVERKERVDRDALLSWCLTGDELIEHKQAMLIEQLEDLLMNISSLRRDPESLEIQRKIIELIIPDGNYLGFHDDLYRIHLWMAQAYAAQGEKDLARECLLKARHHAEESTRLWIDRQTLPYTAPLLDHSVFNYDHYSNSGGESCLEDFAAQLEENVFAALDKTDLM